MNSEYDLVLRTCDSDMTSFDGFKWPNEGDVEAPDWDPEPKFGHGLHGLLHGCGNGNLLSGNHDAKWLVVKILKGTSIDLKGKVKFPKGTVVYAGTKKEAVKIITEAYPGEPVAFAARHSGDNGVSISGDYGVSTSGNDGTSTSGNYGTSTSGVDGTSTSGDYGDSTSGIDGTSTSGIGGKIIIEWYDGFHFRTAVAYVGENGIEPNVAYKLDRQGNFIKA